MLEKVGEMENDPTSSRNTIEPPSPNEDGNTDENPELNDQLYAETFLDEEEDDDSPFENLEFSAINRQLDQLQSALDEIEMRNASIHTELLEILYSNREVRKTISSEINDGTSMGVPENQVPSASPSSDQNHPHKEGETETQSQLDSDSISKNESLLDKANGLLLNTTSVAELLHSVTQDIDKL